MANFSHIIDQILDNKLKFLVAFFFVFSGTYAILYAIDFYPEPKTGNQSVVTVPQSEVVEKTEIETKPELVDQDFVGTDTLPVKMYIDALDKELEILNPASNSVSALDAALLKGVVRHPDSATLADTGNMFILGHSSYLPTVHNKNFQAFNGIQNLKWGDTIRIQSEDGEYVYQIEKVYKAKASAVTVPIRGNGKTLTIATCNSFGSTDDRYIVEAKLISSKKI